MQPLDFTDLPNTRGWRVVHDIDTQLYTIQDENKLRLGDSVYTTKRFADLYLWDYLTKAANLPRFRAKKEE